MWGNLSHYLGLLISHRKCVCLAKVPGTLAVHYGGPQSVFFPSGKQESATIAVVPSLLCTPALLSTSRELGTGVPGPLAFCSKGKAEPRMRAESLWF